MQPPGADLGVDDLRLSITTQWYSTEKMATPFLVHPPKKNIGSAPVLKLMLTARTSFIAYCFVKVFAFAPNILCTHCLSERAGRENI